MFIIYAMLGYFAAAACISAFVLRGQRRDARDSSPDRLTAPAGTARAEAHLLHSATLRGRRLRFYRSPLSGADFPWTVLRDLFEVATDGARYAVSAEWIYADNPELAQVVLTGSGPELLVSHRAGLELLGALLADPSERARLARAFRETMAEAYVLQWAGLSREEFLALCDEASRRPQGG